MVDNFDHVHNPSSLFGFGLSINVFGVWVGGVIENHLFSIGVEKHFLSFIGFFAVIISMFINIPLNTKLSSQLEDHEFIVKFAQMKKKEPRDSFHALKALLTKREFEVFNLLIYWKTDSEISNELFISMHTIKTNNRSIYRKLNVANRVELIEKYLSEEN